MFVCAYVFRKQDGRHLCLYVHMCSGSKTRGIEKSDEVAQMNGVVRWVPMSGKEMESQATMAVEERTTSQKRASRFETLRLRFDFDKRTQTVWSGKGHDARIDGIGDQITREHARRMHVAAIGIVLDYAQ
jgi:hypothetical protein